MKRTEHFTAPEGAPLTLDLTALSGRVVVETTSSPEIQIVLEGPAACADVIRAADLHLRDTTLTVKMPGRGPQNGTRSPHGAPASQPGPSAAARGVADNQFPGNVSIRGNVTIQASHDSVAALQVNVFDGLNLTSSSRPQSDATEHLSVEIHVPYGTHIKATTNAATLIARGRYGRAEVASDEGTVHVGESRYAEISTTSGNVVVGSVHDATLTTHSGRIRVKDKATGQVRARSTGGNIWLYGLQDGAEARNDGGEVFIEESEGHISVSTVTGAITVEVPSATPAEVIAFSHRGTVDAMPSVRGATTRINATSDSGKVLIQQR